jgi:hypothetical protein
VNVEEVALPFTSVVSVSVFVTFDANVPDGAVAGAVKVTATPLTGLPKLSVTVATSGLAKAVLITALCGVPLVAASDAGGPAKFVRMKLADDVAPGTVPPTSAEPATVFAVKTDEVATPLESVVSVSVEVPVVAKVPLAPDNGAENVTVAPLTGFEPAITVTCRFAYAVPTTALCGVPAVAVIVVSGLLDGLHATKPAIMIKLMRRRIDLRNVIGHLR